MFIAILINHIPYPVVLRGLKQSRVCCSSIVYPTIRFELIEEISVLFRRKNSITNWRERRTKLYYKAERD